MTGGRALLSFLRAKARSRNLFVIDPWTVLCTEGGRGGKAMHLRGDGRGLALWMSCWTRGDGRRGRNDERWIATPSARNDEGREVAMTGGKDEFC